MNDPKNEETHFGFQKVSMTEKVDRVNGVFSSVAENYDVMNDVMSMGVHRLWKRSFIRKARPKKHACVLDLASGTGDIACAMQRAYGPLELTLSDINPEMLAVGRDRAFDRGEYKGLSYAIADAEQLPFEDYHFDLITMAFGLRNVARKENALKEAYRVLKPGGRFMVLEFSKPKGVLQPIYDAYSYNLLPKFGEWIAKDRESYQYLVESIRMHPDQETLKQLFEDAGFLRCDYENMSAGIVAIHWGYKL